MRLEVKKNPTGFLIPFDISQMPFNPKRSFFVKNNQANDIRGRHAHQGEEHFLICLNGSINVSKEDKNGIEKFTMEQGDTYYQKELEWLTLEYLEANTCLLVFADALYDESNYIRDYEEYKNILKGQK